ncbi:aldolase [Aspergillus californicus]
MNQPQVNLLEYIRSKTQVDLDTFDVTVANEFGRCVDCTSNQTSQYEYFTELDKPGRKDILHKSIETARKLHGQFADVTFEELTVEVAAVYLGLVMLPAVSGNLHVMANPNYAYSKRKVVDTGKRFHKLFTSIEPSFPNSRLVMKVPATWEGLQACRDLRALGIKTLATTLFTMEQAVLAGEVGCVSISPFLHELKAGFDSTYKDSNPLLDLCVQAQKWYTQQSLPTKIKACANLGLDELLQLTGVDALTIVPDDLRALQRAYRDLDDVAKLSLFQADVLAKDIGPYPAYIDDECTYRKDFDHTEDGQGQFKLAQAIHIFCDFQTKAEHLIRQAKAS